MATIRLSDISVTRGRIARNGLERALGRLLPSPPGVRPFALRHFTLTIPHGRTLVILGPSGCGKSTLVRVIAGLDKPDGGQVLFNGQDVKRQGPGERRIGMLFQGYALYPHFTVRENITSYFRFRRRTPALQRLEAEKFQRTSELLDVEIAYLLNRMPRHLSGGEKQRVALGRCITREPALFLLDEPFSNLDAKLRAKYRLHLKRLLEEFAITTVYVTHDQQEAVLLADLVAVMRMESSADWNTGRLEQVGSVQELYDHPRSLFVADFLNLHPDLPAVGLLDGALCGEGLDGFTIGVRPEDVLVATEPPEPGRVPGLAAEIAAVRDDPFGQHRILTLRMGRQEIQAKALRDAALVPQRPVWLRFGRYHVFDRDSGQAAPAPDAIRARLG
jgi:ABC-type sugar transport system ATPase subunit